MRRVAGLVVLTCCAVPAPAGADEVVARIPNESEIRAYGGVAIVSVFRRSVQRYVLTRVHRDGRLERLRGVPSGDEPFDVDVGPDSRGRPIVVFTRCRPECDLYVHRLGRRGPERIRTASTARWDERRPTVWRARIAWSAQDGERTVIRTRSRLSSRRLAPRQVRGWTDGTGHQVERLELRRRSLASIVYDRDADTSTLRLQRLDGGRARELDRTGFGLSGAQIVGPSFGGHRLGWLVACFGDPSGCAGAGPTTLDLRTGRVTRERGYRARTGYALVPGGTLEVSGGPNEELGEAEEAVEDPETFDSPCAADGEDDRARCPILFRPRRR